MSSIITTKPFDINKFWVNTPIVMKYILMIAFIVVGSYYLFSKTTTISRLDQLDKIEESIEITYDLMDQFEDFEKSQNIYNQQTLTYLQNIYDLVEELNENTNKKFELILQAGGSNTSQILDKITLLNESFEKLQKAYTPKEELKVPEYTEPKIKVTKINK